MGGSLRVQLPLEIYPSRCQGLNPRPQHCDQSLQPRMRTSWPYRVSRNPQDTVVAKSSLVDRRDHHLQAPVVGQPDHGLGCLSVAPPPGT